MMEEKNKTLTYLKPVLIGTLSGAVIITLLFLISAAIIANVNISVPSISIIVCVCGGLGAFASGFIASKILKRRGFFVGIMCGIILCIIIIAATLIFSGSFISGESITKFLVIITAAVLGGAVGVNAKK